MMANAGRHEMAGPDWENSRGRRRRTNTLRLILKDAAEPTPGGPLHHPSPPFLSPQFPVRTGARPKGSRPPVGTRTVGPLRPGREYDLFKRNESIGAKSLSLRRCWSKVVPEGFAAWQLWRQGTWT